MQRRSLAGERKVVSSRSVSVDSCRACWLSLEADFGVFSGAFYAAILRDCILKSFGVYTAAGLRIGPNFCGP